MSAGGVRAGHPDPPGATPESDGVNFSVFSPHAPTMELLLYRSATDPYPARVIRLEAEAHHTSSFWHVLVERVESGTYYAWRAPAGPEPDRGLLDPWAKTVSDRLWDRQKVLTDTRVPSGFRGRVEPEDDYDWEGDRPVDHPAERSVVYELHVGHFTRHDSSGVPIPGTFSGLVAKIPYLQELGITDVELMPVMAFDTQDVPSGTATLGLSNVWGYSPYGFFAPHPGYAAGDDARREFRDMVKAFHNAGIAVILDVVFNHTAEGDHEGPSIHFKALAREVFYHLDPDDPARYRNYSGCGNTVNANHAVVADFIVRCLEYWVQEMHVDGFRFDLASTLTRGEDGDPMIHPPVIRAIESSPILARTKLIAEAWDAHGLYQLGNFANMRWMEWNGQYRDTIRRAVRGKGGSVRTLATRISGSSDMYEQNGKLPVNSINYVTSHDGFTLWDLVSYNKKHNQDNGENDADGTDNNLSWNCGREGPTTDPEIMSLRRRQTRNSVAILLLSQGVPMLSAGDEFHRTQQGNNNAWCQDNPLSWLDWTMAERHADMVRFVRGMISLRLRHASLCRKRFLTGKTGTGRGGQPDIVWYGDALKEPDWDDKEGRVLRFTLAGQGRGQGDLHVILNLSQEPRTFEIPPAVDHRWYQAVNTAKGTPEDIADPEDQKAVNPNAMRVEPRSVVVLESR